jgi:hypothetical protein
VANGSPFDVGYDNALESLADVGAALGARP